jgi:nicotinate-nucleotide pyrophosphorylase (carboxylating)
MAVLAKRIDWRSALVNSQVLQTPLDQLVSAALAEDLGTGDINAELIPEGQIGQAKIITREACVLAGQIYADAAIAKFEGVTALWQSQDGDQLGANDVILSLHGPARALLSLERTVLNFLQTLSATATVTAHYQSLISHTRARILDTRKTIPGLRIAQKYAVRCGGGLNHRIGLFDAFLLKENHIHAAGSITAAVSKARLMYPDRFLQVEVEKLAQIDECLSLNVARVLLDNFSPLQTKEIVQHVNARMQLESSGGIDEQILVAYAEAGVDFISIGSLTKHIRAIDLSMRFY